MWLECLKNNVVLRIKRRHFDALESFGPHKFKLPSIFLLNNVPKTLLCNNQLIIINNWFYGKLSFRNITYWWQFIILIINIYYFFINIISDYHVCVIPPLFYLQILNCDELYLKSKLWISFWNFGSCWKRKISYFSLNDKTLWNINYGGTYVCYTLH